ncbi:MAG: ABC transporter permease [Acidobacteriota bacterium]
MFSTLGQDLRYGARMLLKNPGFSLIAIITLALGIGANTAIFSAVNAVLFRALPYKEPDRLVQIFQRFRPQQNMDRMPVAPANFFDWQAEQQSIEAFAAFRLSNFNLSGDNNPERVRAALASANLFAVLGVEPDLGRTFQAGDDAAGSEPVAVLSNNLWQRRFGGDRSIIGRTIRANNKQYTVIGVMPPGFRFPIGWVTSDVEIWSPLTLEAAERNNRSAITLDVIARLKPNVKLEQAQKSLDALMGQLEQAYPQSNKDWGVNLMPLADRGIIGYRAMFLFLSLAVGLVLLIACVNVANLLLARGIQREKELTIRAALGAGRLRLVRQLLTEGLMLSTLGGLVGVILSVWGSNLLTALAPSDLPQLKQANLNLRVFLFSLGLSVLTGFFFSIFPALSLSRSSLQGALQEGGRGTSDNPRRNRLRAALVVGELGLTVVLLLSAGALIKSFQSYMAVEPGYVAENAITMRIALPAEKYKQGPQWVALFERVEEEVKAIPGVVTAAIGSSAPMEGGGEVTRYTIVGKPEPDPTARSLKSEYIRISPDYFRAAGITLRQGRSFSSSDVEGAPQVAIVNETFARREFPDKNPIGERIRLRGNVNASARDEAGNSPLEIVGVVADIKEYGLYLMTPPLIYAPMRQSPQRTMSLLVKTAGEPTSMLPEIRRRLLKIDPEQPVYNLRTLEQIISENHALFRFNTLLLTTFAAIALALSLIGIYGVVSYSVSQRTREFGIRLALGAESRNIFKLVLSKGAWLIVVGLVLGLAVSYPANKFLARSLKESMNLDLINTGPMLLVVVCGSMTLAVLLACIVPARRATKVDPMIALRSE